MTRSESYLAALRWFLLSTLLCALALPRSAVAKTAAEEAAAVERRLADAARYLTSQELEGRGAGTAGLDLAAEFIAAQFVQAGLKTDLFDGKPFQKFTMGTASAIGKDNKLTLIGPPLKPGERPQAIELAPGTDFTPLAMSGAAVFDAPLVFAGYGISGSAEKYDDFQGIDVAGKVVILLRHEPQQNDPKSVFDGTRDSPHASMARKLAAPRQRKAAAVIFCTDEVEIRKQVADAKRKWHEAIDRLAAENEAIKKVLDAPLQETVAQRKRIEQLVREVEAASKQVEDRLDPLLSARHGGGAAAQPDFPVLHCRRAVLDQAVRAALNTDLATLEQQIDQGPAPRSQELSGWRAAGKTDVGRGRIELKNVAAVLEASGPQAEETIVVGAHYDHVGYGGRGALGGGQGIYPGADDNASGTAVLMEVARSLALRPEKLPRRILFVAFAGEESGLLGSSHYANAPLVPLDKTVAMVNLDMVGRLREDRVSVMGSSSGKPFAELLDRAGRRENLNMNCLPGGPGPSDQMPFYNKGVPVIHFFTGMHTEYHKTTDTFETLNVPGMRRIARLTEEVVVELAKTPQRPEYAKVSSGWMSKLFSGNTRPYLGISPVPAADGAGCGLGQVLAGGPAERAGLKAGDVIVEFGGKKTSSVDQFLEAMQQHKAGEQVKVVLRRGKESLTVEVKLDAPR